MYMCIPGGLSQGTRRCFLRYFSPLIDHLGTRTGDLLIRKQTPDRTAGCLVPGVREGGKGRGDWVDVCVREEQRNGVYDKGKLGVRMGKLEKGRVGE